DRIAAAWPAGQRTRPGDRAAVDRAADPRLPLVAEVVGAAGRPDGDGDAGREPGRHGAAGLDPGPAGAIRPAPLDRHAGRLLDPGHPDVAERAGAGAAVRADHV